MSNHQSKVSAGCAQLLQPPTPILKEANWPLLTVSKGFFENLAQGGMLLLTNVQHVHLCACEVACQT